MFKKSWYFWGQLWRKGTKCDCKHDWLWIRTPLNEMKYLFKFKFSFLRSDVEANRGVEFCLPMPPEFSRKWATECLNNRFPLAHFSVRDTARRWFYLILALTAGSLLSNGNNCELWWLMTHFSCRMSYIETK